MPKVPSPTDCGLPTKFSHWRSNQEHSIGVMITSPKRFIALSAPTGFGKSPAYVAYALLSKKPTCVVTNSKGLQTQLMDDYASCGMVDIRGRGNYPCALRDDYSCQEGYAARCPYKGSINCPSSQAEMRAACSPLVVTNYDKWISCSRSQGDTWLDHFEQVVLDEGHDAPDALARAMQFVITPDDIEKVLELPYPMKTSEFGSWKGWACNAKIIAEDKMKDWQHRLSCEMSPKGSWVKQFLHIKRLVKRLAVIATGRHDNWVVEEVDRGFQFDAVRLGQYAEGVLFLGKPRVIIVSATLRPKTMQMLGLSKDRYDFYEFDSDFDSKRCPIYYIPTMRVDVRAKDLSQLWVRLDQIMSRRGDRKGIIDPISFARRDEIMAASRHRNRMMTNQRGESITHVLEAFRAAGPGTVLISPSVGTGYDFPMKQAEWQFIAKVPFPDGRAKIQQARQAWDPEFGAYGAMQSLVQFFGRSMRSRDDRSEGFICDGHLEWFLPRYRHLAPKSFHSHFRMVNTVPQPPEAL
jgi:Rad3-related DNA helicase